MRLSFEWLTQWVKVDATAHEVAERLTMSGVETQAMEINGEMALEVSITPNRGDCLSVIGLAREVAAIFNVPMTTTPKSAVSFGKGKDFRVERVDESGSPFYSAWLIKGLTVKPSEGDIARRLEVAGFRLINNIVDVTNYIMLETGQPLHAFDRQLVDQGTITVKRGYTQAMTLLDGRSVTLEPTDVVIGSPTTPLALGGVMGGQNSGIQAGTTDVIVESAYFDPLAIRKASKRLGVVTESSRRFERGVDPLMVTVALERAATLISQQAGGALGEAVSSGALPSQSTRIRLTASHVDALLGAHVPKETIDSILSRLGMTFTYQHTEWQITPPSHRHDLERDVDIIEEIARLWGYDQIPTTFPKMPVAPATVPANERVRTLLSNVFVNLGFAETIHYGFVPANEAAPYLAGRRPVIITNPLGNDEMVMKPSLISGLVADVDMNLRFGTDSGRLFERRPVFVMSENGVTQHESLALVMFGNREGSGWTTKDEKLDFYDLKGVVESSLNQIGLTMSVKPAQSPYLHPGESADIYADGHCVGVMGRLHPDLAGDISVEIWVAELDLSALEGAVRGKSPYFVAPDRYPSVRRDVSFFVDHAIPHSHVYDIIAQTDGLIRKIELFDMYKGKGVPAGKKSMAYAIWYVDPTKTLSDDDVRTVHDRVVDRIRTELNGEIR